MGDRRLEIGRRCHSYYCSIFPHISSGNRVQSFFVSPVKREWKCLTRYARPAMGTGGPPVEIVCLISIGMRMSALPERWRPARLPQDRGRMGSRG